MIKSEYIIQPHEIGSKQGKSWFLLVPAVVAREFQLGRNTVFALRPEKETGVLTFERVYDGEKIIEGISEDQTLECTNQHRSQDVKADLCSY